MAGLNLTSLTKNPKTLGAVGVAAAAGFGLYVHHKRATTPTTSSSSGTTQTVQPATYDGIASDVYASLQPQLQTLADQVNQLANQPPPNPVPTTPPAPSGLTPIQHALLTATPQQFTNFSNMVAWINANPGKDFGQSLAAWTHTPPPAPGGNNPAVSGHF